MLWEAGRVRVWNEQVEGKGDDIRWNASGMQVECSTFGARGSVLE